MNRERKLTSFRFLCCFRPFRPEHMDHSWHRELHKQDRVLYFPKELSMVYRNSLLLRGLAISLQLNYSVGQQWKQHAQKAVERHPQVVQEILQERKDSSSRASSDTVINATVTESLPLRQ